MTNVYLLIDYGDFIDGTTVTDKPYVQLLSMTDPAAAHADFVKARLGGADTTGSQHGHSNPNPGSGSPEPGSKNTNKMKSLFEKYKTPLLIAAAVAGALAILSTAFYLFRSRRAVYRPLFEPAPQGSMQMHYVSGYNTGNTGNTGAPYADPWSRR